MKLPKKSKNLVSSIETNSYYFGRTFNIKLKGKITRTNDSFPAF